VFQTGGGGEGERVQLQQQSQSQQQQPQELQGWVMVEDNRGKKNKYVDTIEKIDKFNGIGKQEGSLWGELWREKSSGVQS
jgi:hypothetical protein